jgi:PAC2 family
MEHARFVGRPVLHNPALVVAFTGWGDAGAAASSAALLLLRDRDVAQLVSFDSESFYVLTSVRPLVRELAEGRRIVWPSLGFLAGQSSGAARDLVVLVAAEPQLRWRAFSKAVAETWLELGGGPAILLGSFLAEAPPLGPVPLFGSGNTSRLAALLRALNVVPNNYGGPTTALLPVYEALAGRDVACADIWSAIPHRLFRLPNPKATAALLRVVCRLLWISLDLSDLEQAARSFDAGIQHALAKTRQAPQGPLLLPTAASSSDSMPTAPLPNAEEAIREVERYLGLGPRGRRSAEGPSG